MSSGAIPLYLVDAFAAGPFTGNPAGVCLLDSWPGAVWMQNVAAEMKQAETAFLVGRGELYELRWFTPAVEVDLCGHATLASAVVLWDTNRVPNDREIVFSTRSGPLKASRQGELVQLDFPLEPQEPVAPPPELAALGVLPVYVGKSRFDYFVVLETEAQLRALAPDMTRLKEIECRGVIVTAPAASGPYDFVSRFFAPACAVDEDPVTGSALCTLAHYWQARLGKSSFRAYQASPRGGSLEVVVERNRVLLRGHGRIVTAGNWVG